MIYRSKACLIQRDGEMADAKQQLIDRLLTRIQGVIQARESKYIMMHAPTERRKKWLPCCRAPSGRLFCRWQATSSAWRCTWSAAKPCSGETMEKLKALGASSILVLPIENDGVIGQPVTDTQGNTIMSFNTIIDWNGCSADQQQQLLTRPAISASDSISKTVTEI